jgi:simple sugar transport system ATP-binding protein
LFVVLKKLVSQGCSLLYISHKLHEIRELCSACTVLRGGEVTGVCDPREESNASLSRMMIGAEPPALKHQDRTPGALLFEARHLSLPKEDQFGVNLVDINLQVCAGEVVGIAGVSGNGQRELLYALSGEDTRAAADSVHLDGEAVGRVGPHQRRQAGLHFVPEERLGRGAVPSLSLSHNMLLTRSEAMSPSGWIDMQVLQAQAQKIIQQFNVKANGPQAPAQSLSGGNLQKFIVGREIDAQPKVLLVSQPTWGVDVGAAAQIRSELLALRDAGCALLVVSEELDELFEISDRLYVMANGKLSPSIQRKDATVAQIGEWMSGLWEPHAET